MSYTVIPFVYIISGVDQYTEKTIMTALDIVENAVGNEYFEPNITISEIERCFQQEQPHVNAVVDIQSLSA
jgi:hypothetical protein